jgi:hypothetical protein
MGFQEETRKCFQGGNGATAPPILARLFSTDQKRGWGFDPPYYLVLQQKLIANALQNAAKCCKMPQNAAKHCKCAHGHRQFAAKCRKMLQNAPKCRKTPENAGKRRKTPENAAKCHKYCKLAISLRRTKYLGGLKTPAP